MLARDHRAASTSSAPTPFQPTNAFREGSRLPLADFVAPNPVYTRVAAASWASCDAGLTHLRRVASEAGLSPPAGGRAPSGPAPPVSAPCFFRSSAHRRITRRLSAKQPNFTMLLSPASTRSTGCIPARAGKPLKLRLFLDAAAAASISEHYKLPAHACRPDAGPICCTRREGDRLLRRIGRVQLIYESDRLNSAWRHVREALADLRLAKFGAEIQPTERNEEQP